MALTAEQTAYYESRLGKPLDVVDIEARYARLLSDAKVASEVLETRIATMLTKPLSFTIPGDYQEDRKDNVAHLKRMLELAQDEASEPTATSTLRAVPPAPGRWAR